jgi:hypothetical protein
VRHCSRGPPIRADLRWPLDHGHLDTQLPELFQKCQSVGAFLRRVSDDPEANGHGQQSAG